VLGAATAGPVLLGGYHGTWARPGELAGLTVSRATLAGHGLTLGAGVVLPLAAHDCPVDTTVRVVRYLAGQSAGRCGPCRNGLPALAAALARLADGDESALQRVQQLAGLVARRGACAHPDGTVRLVGSLLTAYGDEVTAHLTGGCAVPTDERRAG
jgi:NADH:ubiquinone oxidoreductase subunit F (NADH-binding)